MKRTAFVTILLALLPLLACGKTEKPADGSGPKAETPAAPSVDLLAKALEAAAAAEKNVLVEYYDVTCPFCTQMDREVYTDEFVKDALTQVVYVRLERKKTGKPFEDRFGEQRTPTFAVLGPDGTQHGELVTGFLSAGVFADYIDWAANPDGEMPELQPGGS